MSNYDLETAEAMLSSRRYLLYVGFMCNQTIEKAFKAYFSNWHLNDDPTTQGFDVNIGGCHAGNPGNYILPYTLVPIEIASDDYHLINLIMDKTLAFPDSVGEQPFFMYCSPYAVHALIQPVKSLQLKHSKKIVL